MSGGSHDALVHRLSLMLLKLSQGDALEPRTLAEEFGVNLRTIQRNFNSQFSYLPLQECPQAVGQGGASTAAQVAECAELPLSRRTKERTWMLCTRS
jgi:hypothetical protein